MTIYYPFYPHYVGEPVKRRPIAPQAPAESLAPKSAAEIIRDVAERHGLTVDELKGPNRAQKYAIPRHEAMWLIYQTGRFSNEQVARMFGGRDHTSVIHAREAHERRMRAERMGEGA